MAISLAQTAVLGALGSGTTQQTSAFGANPTVGNYLVAWAWGWGGGGAGSSFSFADTGSNTYTFPTNAKQGTAVNDVWCMVAYTKVATTGASFKVTATVTGGSNGSIMVVASEFSGVAASSPLDGTAAAGATASTGVPAPGSLTLASGSLAVGVFSSDQTTYTTFGYGTPSGFTRVGFQDNGSSFQVGEAVYAIGPASPSNPSWKTGTVNWAAVQFALKSAAGGAAFVADPPYVVRQAVPRAAYY
jgi:hypothetical protein